ncbi:hypothetical protein [Clostridium oceanicum]|uniref:YxeA family protein n=1 Tax=Clostridium oceanicum TaxID=1543 RepID=A0ABN1JRG3_9CLOT
MRKKFNKKSLVKKLIAFMFILLFIFIIYHNYKVNKQTDITYTVENYMTTGLFNKYRMYSIDNFDLTFSDGNIAVVKVFGTDKESPHKRISYKVFVEKNKKGIWKVKKVYKENTTAKKDEYYKKRLE